MALNVLLTWNSLGCKFQKPSLFNEIQGPFIIIIIIIITAIRDVAQALDILLQNCFLNN